MKGNQIWTIVGVSLIVAIIASVATASITGNAIIKQNNYIYGKYQIYTKEDVYTKKEVDSLISNLNSQLRYGEGSITYDMLVRLNKCTVVKDKQESGVISCNDVCKKALPGTICVLGEYSGTIRPCSDNAGSIKTDRFCKCCGII